MVARELRRLGLERGLREVTIAAAVSSMNSGDAESLAATRREIAFAQGSIPDFLVS
jgi:hypothetical protein